MISKRNINKTAAIENTNVGVGISTSARLFWRHLFKSQPQMLGTNKDINEIIAMDYSAAQPVHRFKLKDRSGWAEIRKSKSFYFIGAVRANGRHDVIVIQPAWKVVDEKIRQRRLSPEGMREQIR